jgi:hypothetical protein
MAIHRAKNMLRIYLHYVHIFSSQVITYVNSKLLLVRRRELRFYYLSFHGLQIRLDEKYIQLVVFSGIRFSKLISTTDKSIILCCKYKMLAQILDLVATYW